MNRNMSGELRMSKIFQQVDHINKGLGRKFIRKVSIYNNTVGIVLCPASSLGKNIAIEWPKLIWKQYPQEHGLLSKIHKAVTSWKNTSS